MTNQQKNVLIFIYKRDGATQEMICGEFNLTEKEFGICFYDFDNLCYVDNDVFKLTNAGISYIEKVIFDRRNFILTWAFNLFTLAIATAAFIQGFFVLP